MWAHPPARLHPGDAEAGRRLDRPKAVGNGMVAFFMAFRAVFLGFLMVLWWFSGCFRAAFKGPKLLDGRGTCSEAAEAAKMGFGAGNPYVSALIWRFLAVSSLETGDSHEFSRFEAILNDLLTIRALFNRHTDVKRTRST